VAPDALLAGSTNDHDAPRDVDQPRARCLFTDEA
jgi:hypothetical protein